MDTFSTARLQARRIRATDLPYVILTDTDPEIFRWTYGVSSSHDQSEARLERWQREEREAQVGFWIFSSGVDDIGHAGLFRSARIPNEIELGYIVRPPFWRQGYATEMALAIIENVARPLNLPRLIAITYAANLESQRILDKCGFSPDGEYVNPEGVASPRYLLNL